ncbi:ABC transporter substrate-binding protein [Aliamphritea spongicola]|uniref:ABC transporter substrate-binding protein n=1 Tax=Aliamphritea spongicola TaxID=707589 RepID=UPI00196B176B|nr:ABC transporter substrate-binding protein [Aliamphritea spongicola]MBN3563562.1 ABC transporter substrate-binding protein [Aliamphritea spongicola]
MFHKYLTSILLITGCMASPVFAQQQPIPYFAKQLASGTLPPMAERLPESPAKPSFFDKETGQYGGKIRMLMAKAKDIRLMVAFGYSRLVGYDDQLQLKADILKKVEIEEGRIFTLHLRPGMRWSDGTPFTSEDFRFYWEDIATNETLSPFGPAKDLLSQKEKPVFEVIDEYTVKYSWNTPNPYFLPALAGPRPLFIYMPAHYMKQFHADYQTPEKLTQLTEEAHKRNWRGLFVSKGRQYKLTNPDLPSLQPWVNTTRPPAERFIFKRNPYFHRVDPNGQQLPYIDEVEINLASAGLIPAKAGSGEVDLQARYLRLDNYTFLKEGEENGNYQVNLWETGRGAQIALYPNMNAKDPEWRKLMQDVRFRRALSMAVNRNEINQVVYFGLAKDMANTVLPSCPLFKTEYATAWSDFNTDAANRLLDDIGLTKRDARGIRLLPDGNPMEILVQTAGESTEETDVLSLVEDSWKRIGVQMYVKPTQREVLRNRVFSGEAIMSAWYGLPNGVPVASMSPSQMAPTRQDQYQWPQWGRYYETGKGKPSKMPEVQELVSLNNDWGMASSEEEQARIWNRMLEIHADQVFSIGLVSGVLQPMVVNENLMNVPENAFYNWDPGAYFGIHNMAGFFYKDPE